jgi:hypothetical protein
MENTNLKNNHLSVELGGGFSFLLEGDCKTKTISGIDILTKFTGENDQVGEIMRSSLTGDHIKSVSISFCNNQFTLIPESLFEKEKAHEILALNIPLDEGAEVHSAPVHHLHARLLFATGKEKKDLEKNFPNAVFSHCAMYFLNRLPMEMNGGDEFHICFYPGLFLLAGTSGKNLLFCNSFHYRSPEDVVYFLLFTAEQLRFDPGKIRLYISGEIEPAGPIAELLQKYFLPPVFTPQLGEIRFTNGIQVQYPHRFPNLIDQFRCGS